MDKLSRAAPLILVTASIVILGAALASEYFGGLRPCQLCLYQRWPYVAVIVAGLLAYGAGKIGQRLAVRLLIALAAVALFVGAGIAAYHVGVEQKWWPGPDTCAVVSGLGKNVDELLAEILDTPPVRCDEAQWSLFGISMAGYNFIVSVALAVFALAAARHKRFGR